MELPFHLKTLPEEALAILRYYSTLPVPVANTDSISEGADLTPIRFGKALRRLVTKGYLTMDGDQVYRLTDMGRSSVIELLEFDAAAPPDELEDLDLGRKPPRIIARRVILALPQPLVANQPINLFVGFDDADEDSLMRDPVSLILRLAVVNGEPARAKESPFTLTNRAARQVFEVIPGAFNRTRVRLQLFQMSEDAEDIWDIGGMYVDSDVQPYGSSGGYASFSAEVNLTVFE